MADQEQDVGQGTRWYLPVGPEIVRLFSSRGLGVDLLRLEIDETSLGFKESVRLIQAARDQLPDVVDDYV